MAVPDDGRTHQISFGASLGNRCHHIISYSVCVSLVWGDVSESAA